MRSTFTETREVSSPRRFTLRQTCRTTPVLLAARARKSESTNSADTALVCANATPSYSHALSPKHTDRLPRVLLHDLKRQPSTSSSSHPPPPQANTIHTPSFDSLSEDRRRVFEDVAPYSQSTHTQHNPFPLTKTGGSPFQTQSQARPVLLAAGRLVSLCRLRLFSSAHHQTMNDSLRQRPSRRREEGVSPLVAHYLPESAAAKGTYGKKREKIGSCVDKMAGLIWGVFVHSLPMYDLLLPLPPRLIMPCHAASLSQALHASCLPPITTWIRARMECLALPACLPPLLPSN